MNINSKKLKKSESNSLRKLSKIVADGKGTVEKGTNLSRGCNLRLRDDKQASRISREEESKR